VKISIIIPVYNEFRTLDQVLSRVLAAPLQPGCDREIIVIDDGSTDGTREIVRRHADSGIVLAHQLARNFGKGVAIRAGIALATGEVVVIQDGDLEYDPRDYARLIEPILRGEAEIVYGSRFLGRPTGMVWKNRVANRILTAAANLLYGAGITDEATAYKAFRLSVLRSLRLESERFEFCPEVTAKTRRLGLRIVEVPIGYNARGIAEGKKIQARDGFQALWTLVKYRFARRASLQAQSPIRPAEMARCEPDSEPGGAARRRAPAARPGDPDSSAAVPHSRRE
jgi:glycosyltransferase involved in cell wall biosynthesis